MRVLCRRLCPIVFLTLLVSVLFLSSYYMDRLLTSVGEPIPDELKSIRFLVLIMGIIVYALSRTSKVKLLDRNYRQWLMLTPWTNRKPLPLESVYLGWIDFAVVMFFTVLTIKNGFLSPLLPAIAFMAIYVFSWCSALLKLKEYVPVIIIMFVAPLAYYPFANYCVTLMVMIGLYGLVYWGLQNYLRSFPWNTVWWKHDIRELLCLAGKKFVDWPYKMLAADQKKPAISFKYSLILCALFTWWLNVP